MTSQLKLHLDPSLVETLSSDQLPAFSTLPLEFSNNQLFNIDEGHILIQSISYYMAHLETFEYSLTKDTTINFSIEGNPIYLVINFSGDRITSDHLNNHISKDKGSCCYLIQQKAGSYCCKLKAGTHKVIILTLRPDLLLQKADEFPEFKTALENSKRHDSSTFDLPQCPVNKEIRKAIKLLTTLSNNQDEAKFYKAISGFINQALKNYHSMLSDGRYLTSIIHKKKATELDLFLKENYASTEVVDVSFIASKLLVSESQLLLIVNKEFNMPLHKYVIHHRMHQAFKQLISTDKKIHQISKEVGYTDTHYFSRAFKKFFSISPNEISRIGIQ